MNVQLSLKVPADPIISGAPLQVRTLVRNTGAEPVELPPAGTLSPLTFVVRDANGRVVASGGAQDSMSSRLGVPAPIPAPGIVSPGAEIAYEEEISSYFGRALAPGRYELVAELRRAGSALASASAILVVERLTPDAVVRAAGSGGLALSTLMAHRHGDGRRTLFYTFADTSGRWTGTLRPLYSISAAPVATLALVPQALKDPSFAWAASIDGEAIRGVLVRPFDTANAFGPVPLAAGAARLLETGVPLPDGGALLLALSRDGSTLVVIQLNRTGNSTLHRLGVPPSLSASAFVALAVAKDVRRVHVCWAEGENTMHDLSFSVAAPEKEPRLSVIYKTARRIVAVQADPPASAPSASLHLIEAPTGADVRVLLTRLSLDNAAGAESTPIPTPPVDIRETRRWLLPSSNSGANGPVLVAAAGGKTWLLENGSWRTVDVALANTPGARLIRYGEALWLSAWSPQTGVHLQRLPAAKE